MANPCIFEDLGAIGYEEALAVQEKYFKELSGCNTLPHRLLFCEHPHVFTLGRFGSAENLLVPATLLHDQHIKFHKTGRGGDITFHGPGQIVTYYIFNLGRLQLGIRQFVDRIEESIIQTVKEFGIISGRLPGATGVWLDADSTKPRKICAIGVKASRNITMHGSALNVKTDLKYFTYINPCGFTDKQVTSIEKEMQPSPSIEEVKRVLKAKTFEAFGMER